MIHIYLNMAIPEEELQYSNYNTKKYIWCHQEIVSPLEKNDP